MKKGIVYLLGILTGIILTILFLNIYSRLVVGNKDRGITYFQEPGKVMAEQSYQVFQVFANGNALAMAKSTDSDLYLGITALILAQEGTTYYDKQIIEPEIGKCFRQVGTYYYTSMGNGDKTVPVIALFNGDSGLEQDANRNPKITYLSETGDIIEGRSFKVGRVDDYGSARANAYSGYDMYFGTEVIFEANEESSYYDGQIIRIPQGKCLRQIGVYKSTLETLPVVAIFDK